MPVSGGVRTAAVLFTDLAGSTAMRSRLGEERAERLRLVHDAAVRRAIEGAGGTVVKSLGDGHMATFLSAADAVAAAVAVQQEIDRHNRRVGSEPLGVRVGVSAGDVAIEGSDCHGLPVIEAQRLESAARPGQILCAELVVQMARGRGDHVFEPVGPLVLKGLATPVEAREVVWAPSASPTDEVLPPTLRRASSLPFTGRKAEQQILVDAWERCRVGGFATVFVAGEPGIGKTRLISEVAADASVEGAMVLAGRCDEDIRVPFGPFVEALRWLIQHLPVGELPARLGKHPGELVTLVPEIAQLLPGAAPSASADAETERFQLFSAVCSWLGSGGPSAPTVLALDDLHWADTGTVQLLRHLVSNAPGGLLVLGTYRDTDISRAHPLGAALADLRRAGTVSRVVLGGLSEAGVRDLVEAAGGQPLESPGLAFADLVQAETAGNPLFVSEVLLHLAETGDLAFRDGRWAMGRDLAVIGIPEGIREVIGRRLSLLPPDTEAVLRTAAIVGLEFDVALLSAVLDRSEGEVLDLLERAVSAALVVEVGVDRFRFAHALVRETLHAELTASRRAREHRRVATAIETRYAGDLEQMAPVLAMHWGEACAGGDPTTAVQWAAMAGEHDLERRAPDEAARWFARALDLCDDHQPDDGRRRRLLSRLAHAQSEARDPSAETTANAAAELALAAGDLDAAAKDLCLTVWGTYHSGQEPDVQKIELLERTLDLMGDGDHRKRGPVLSRLGGELVSSGDSARRNTIVDELLRLLDTVEDPVERWELMRFGTVGSDRRWADRPAMTKVLRYCKEATGCLSDSFERMQLQHLRWTVAVALGERNECDEVLAALAREETPAGNLVHRNLTAAGAYLDGRLHDYERLTDDVLEEIAAVGGETDSYRFCRAFLLLREQARFADLVEVASHPQVPYPSVRVITQLLVGAPELISFTDIDPDQLPDVDNRSAGLAWTAESVAAVGEDRLVRQVLRLVEPFHGMHLDFSVFYWGPYDRLTALLRSRLGDHELANAAFARAVQATQSFRTPVWVARTELDWAESLLRRGLHRAAAAHVQDARVAIGELPLIDSRNRADQLDALLA